MITLERTKRLPIAWARQGGSGGNPVAALNSAAVNAKIRQCLIDAARLEASKRQFTLSGRGHEPRVTLDRRLAAILRGVRLPYVRISGFGANLYYPKRIFETAIEKLRIELGKSPITMYERTGTVYRSSD